MDTLDYNLHFFHVETIASFNKRIHDKWAMASIAVVVIHLQGKIDGHFKLIVADGDSSEDVQRVQRVQLSFQPMFHNECDFLVQQFRIKAPTLTLVKNMCATSVGVVQYQTNPIMIFALVVNEDIIM